MTTSAATHLDLGRRGEDFAVTFLRGYGLIPLARNWRCRDGELDLILTERGRLVVCEVKTRTSTRFGTPAEAITDAKATRIRQLARRWCHTYGVIQHPRFDILSILWPRGGEPTAKHIPGAF